MGNFNSINLKDAREMIKNKQFELILDVRTSKEWKEGHYPSAINIPLNELANELEFDFGRIYPNKNMYILIYCKSGNRASKAYNILQSRGYKNVFFLGNGGYKDLIITTS